MIDAERLEQEWITSLVREAERDLVFLWQITKGKFGGPTYTSAELPALIERIARELINSGCTVGFGDPDSETWRTETDVMRAENPGMAIAARWASNAKDTAFLVFVRRKNSSDLERSTRWDS